MHVFPQLRKAEHKYARELAVVGVHSAKFAREKLTESIREAAERYMLQHPIVNDRDYAVWQRFGVRAWPTLVFIDPEGRVIGSQGGEISFEALDQLLGEMVTQFDRAGVLDRRPLSFGVQIGEFRRAGLAFPGKVLADAESERLFIADSNHHRILVTDLDGTVQSITGRGEPGWSDGTHVAAAFNWPQGLALVGDHLYVADTENHLIRRVNLPARRVETVAGTGMQAPGPSVGGPALETPLSSPWDLDVLGGTLFIAMAGLHQVWAMDLDRGTVWPHAGSGYEGIQDGPLADAWLAQPSGVAADDARLYIADSESSGIRAIDAQAGGRVQTVVGTDLFNFGDRDGAGDEVLLQHPLGVLFHDGMLYVADTYNHKIKRCGVATRAVTTWSGTGASGYTDGPRVSATFNEPSGLSAALGRMYVADTNNHAVRVIDLATDEVSTLRLQGL